MKPERSSVLPTGKPTKLPAFLWTDAEFAERCPGLYEFLAAGIVEGEPRKGGSISLFVSQARLKVCYMDKQTQTAFYGVLDGKGELWDQLEQMLVGEHEPWAPVRGGNGKPVF